MFKHRVHSVLLKKNFLYAILLPDSSSKRPEGDYSDMNQICNDKELSKQQLKSKETKARIFKAARHILQKKGYEELSIKNICEEAGVSNGSFYHHFKTKDDLLSYYIEEQPGINPDLLDLPSDAADAKKTIIYVYINYVHYCKELGMEFMSNYYTPKNQSLNPLIRTERPYPIITVENYLKKCILNKIKISFQNKIAKKIN